MVNRKAFLAVIATAVIALSTTHADANMHERQARIDARSQPTGATGRTAVRGLFNLFGYKTPQQVREEQQKQQQVDFPVNRVSNGDISQARCEKLNINCSARF